MMIQEARTLIPKVGDIRIERPTIDQDYGHNTKKPPQKCKVVAVNAEHLWYTVEFEDGIRESYKVPNNIPDVRGPER